MKKKQFLLQLFLLKLLHVQSESPNILILSPESSGEKENFETTEQPSKSTLMNRFVGGKIRVGDWHKTISKSYDKDERPDKNAVTLVNTSIWIIKIYSISESEMAYSIDLFYQEMWKDTRLAFDPELFGNQSEINLPARVLHQVWQPDTYFLSARSMKEPDPYSITHSTTFRLTKDGSVWYSRRLALSADCPMDLTFYPFDKQDCRLKIGSYGRTNDKIRYRWRDFSPIVFETILLPEFGLQDYKHMSRTLSYISGNYSTIEFCFILERNYGYCLIQLIIPAAAVVMSSWVALWLQDETQFSDVIAVILAIIFLSYANNSVMPRVSYVKLMDVYLGACFLFVFISLGKG